jgi:N-acetylglucosamine-6-phosphate deacetylase
MALSKDTLLLRGMIPGDNDASDLRIEGGVVMRLSRAGKDAADFGSEQAILAPALFDMQVNGAGGHDLQGTALRVETVQAITDYLAAWGVARWVPTLVTGPIDEMEHGCRVIAEALRDRRLAKAIPGIHLEGPWISPEDGPRGAHPRKHVRPPNRREFHRLYRAAEGKISYVTLAPEWPGAPAFIRMLVSGGITVALGHHQADARQIAAAADAGARCCTHLGNGASAQMHRHHNPLWPQLAEDRFYASLIADLHHLPEPVLKSFVRAKGPDRVILVSDCVNLAGLRPGKYRFAGAEVEMKRNGKICLSGTDLLAGSSLMLLQGVVNAWRHAGLSLAQAFAAATVNPAALLGLRGFPVRPQVGRQANLIVFMPNLVGQLAQKNIEAVFIDGARRDA